MFYNLRSRYFLFFNDFNLGVTLGLQKKLSDAMSIFVGVSLHACLISLVVSLTALKVWVTIPQIPLKKCALIQLIMCLFRPIGIMLGLLVQRLGDDETNMVSAILMSLSTGVFLHVTFLSLIPAEFPKDQKNNCKKSVSEETEIKSETFREKKELDLEPENTASASTSLLTTNEDPKMFALFKIVFFVCGWLVMSLLPLITGHDHH